MNNVLVDTNVFVYATDSDSKYHVASKRFLEYSTNNLFTTSKNLSEILVVLTRGSIVIVNIETAIKTVKSISQTVNILYPSEHSYSIFLELLSKYKPKGLHIHDFEIVSIGLAFGISKFVTFDRSDFENIKEVELIQI